MPEEDQPDPYSVALLLDFDGTLVEIADHPGRVIIREDMRSAISSLHKATDGALAVISGRPIAELDAFLSPLRLPLAGVHGLEIRGPDGRLQTHDYEHAALDRLIEAARIFERGRAGLLVETKPGSVALHYRQAPALEPDVSSFAEEMARSTPGAKLMHGKMVTELRLGDRNKAHAVDHLMELPPFAGRQPWFFGDDVTDEDAFARVNDMGGRTFKIGPGDSKAAGRFADTAAFHRWLVRTARACADANDMQGGHHAKGGNRGGLREHAPSHNLGSMK